MFKRISYRYLVFYCQSALKSVFSDTDISQESIIWAVKIIVNKVKKKSIEPTASGSYLATFTNLPTSMQFDGANNTLRNKKYIELPANIFDLDRDGGVDWLAYDKTIKDENEKVIFCEPIYFQRSTLIQLREMGANGHERPSPDSPYFVRVNNLLYLAGIEVLPKVILNGAFFITENPYIGEMLLDDTILLNDEQIADVVAQVLALGKWALMQPKDSTEEGTDLRIPQITKEANMALQQPPPDQNQQQ